MVKQLFLVLAWMQLFATAVASPIALASDSAIGADAADEHFRRPIRSFRAGPENSYPVAGDLNEDGWPDVLLPTRDNFGTHYTLSLLLGEGDGILGTALDINPIDPAFTAALADLNEDGHLDIVVGAISSFTSIQVLLGTGDGTFYYYSDTTNFEVGDGPHFVAVGDFNQDQHVDAVVAHFAPPALTILPGTGHGTFGAGFSVALSGAPRMPAVADVNRDGLLDVVVPSGNTAIMVFMGQGDGTLEPGSTYSVPFRPSHVTLGDWNGDGAVDCAVAIQAVPPGGRIAIFVNDGMGQLLRQADLPGADRWSGIVNCDLNGDGHPDLIAGSTDSSRTSVFLGGGDGTFWPFLDAARLGSPGRHLAITDLDRDGLNDVVVARNTDSVAVLMNAGHDVPTPVAASLIRAEALGATVQLAWWLSKTCKAAIWRTTSGESWVVVAQRWSDGNGVLAFEDNAVVMGETYGYKLGLTDDGGESFVSEVWVQVPAPELAIRSPWGSPSHDGRLWVAFELRDSGPSTLELFDVAGRELTSRQVGTLGPGAHALDLAEGLALRPGVYFLRLTQGGREARARVAVIK